MKPFKLKEGWMYRIRTLVPPQRLEREHMLTYLGDYEGELQFNARPIAGTQSFRWDQIQSIEVVDTTNSPLRESDEHYMNVVVR
jgi:hypothetical protein